MVNTPIKLFLLSVALIGLMNRTHALDSKKTQQSNVPLYQHSQGKLNNSESKRELLKLLAELDLAQNREASAHIGPKGYDSLQNPLSLGRTQEGTATSACSTALALYQIIGKNCVQAAHTLNTLLANETTHTYIKSVLYDLFTRAKDPKNDFSLSHIPEELSQNERFTASLKEGTSGTLMKIEEKKDLALPALKELHRHLHYYTWLKALSHTKKSFSTSTFHIEPFRGLPENLRLIIWSMINDSDE